MPVSEEIIARPEATPTTRHPLPFRQFILKITSRCNLACDYCYMYELADDTWRGQPKRMSADTVKATADRIAEHAETHDLKDVHIVLHGGEPLLAGPDYIGTIATTLRAATTARVELGVQTNGTLLSEAMIDTLASHDIKVGVSLDGAPDDNDGHRRYANGRGSYGDVACSLGRLRTRAPQLFAGIICTINLDNDPVRTYSALRSFAPPRLDFQLPHGNWTTPPPGRDPGSTKVTYGKWLTTVFDQWYGESPRETSVRMFSEIIHLMLGGQSQVETIGLAPVAFIVVNTDGALEQVDALRSAFNGAAGTGLNVAANAFDAALTHPAIVARQLGVDGLSSACKKCALHRVCGGGLYAHRFQSGTGFLNPSVYCHDLAYLIRHIHRQVSGDVARLAALSKGPA